MIDSNPLCDPISVANLCFRNEQYGKAPCVQIQLTPADAGRGRDISNMIRSPAELESIMPVFRSICQLVAPALTIDSLAADGKERGH